MSVDVLAAMPETRFFRLLGGLSTGSWWWQWMQHRPAPVIDDPALIDAYFRAQFGG